MSKEVYTTVVDSYQGSEQDPVELPEHIRNYGDIRLDPGATATEKAAHEAEMSRVWRENYNLGQLFHGVDSEKFDQAHDQLLVHAVNSHIIAQRLVESMDLKGPAIHKQIVRETMLAIEDEAARQAELLLPLTSENYLDEDNVLFRRVKLVEMLVSDIDVKADGQAIKRQPKTYQNHLKDWRKYEQLAFAAEVELLHHQANLDNARFNSDNHRRAHQHNYQKLDADYGGLFGRIRRLPIDHYHIPLLGSKEISLNSLADDFESERDALLDQPETKKIIGGRRTAASDKTDKPGIANRLIATKHLEPVLRSIRRSYEGQGLSGAVLRDIMEEVDGDLKAWLADDEARNDYYLYETSKNGYDMRVKKGGRSILRLVNRVGNDAYVGLPIGIGFRRRPKYGLDMPHTAKDAMRVKKLGSATLTPRAAVIAPKKRWPNKVYIGRGDKPAPPSRI